MSHGSFKTLVSRTPNSMSFEKKEDFYFKSEGLENEYLKLMSTFDCRDIAGWSDVCDDICDGFDTGTYTRTERKHCSIAESVFALIKYKTFEKNRYMNFLVFTAPDPFQYYISVSILIMIWLKKMRPEVSRNDTLVKYLEEVCLRKLSKKTVMFLWSKTICFHTAAYL